MILINGLSHLITLNGVLTAVNGKHDDSTANNIYIYYI